FYVPLVLSIVAILLSAYNFVHPQQVTVYKTIVQNSSAGSTQLQGYNISSALITPPTSLASAPVITANQSFGQRLTGINQPFNASELAVINNAPNSLYELAGEMYLNHTLNNSVAAQSNFVPLFKVNGKPSVIYMGSITCIFCGENRWAMALALSKFGTFNSLYTGYSSLGDSDAPTIYWRPASYNTSTTDLGSFYQSNYINFIAIEDTHPISGGFALNPLAVIQKNVQSANNTAYTDAINYILQINNFQGTPYTIWGNYQVGGADAIAFGNSTPTGGGSLPLTYMSHQNVLSQLQQGKSQFALTQYAGADVYIAYTCKSINNKAGICSLPAIQKIEALQ
ncbi:MAG: DUF929 family protein, partial [Candidatus Micrarchaeota archaeon]|nr:DUF929 family protein [Candidatus Micrarchaeota archaeon]